MKSADISVIVPVYNVEDYLEDCLDSLLRQEDVSLEVIMIDDGSTDDSGVIADEYAGKYPDFSCIHIENGGLGHARNVGVKYASGKYIIFLDSDDIVVDNAYTRMFKLAEKHDAELTICNVERFNSIKRSVSSLHKMAFLNYEEVSHITKNYSLIHDTTSWNKLIRRDFYERNNFAFPEKILYEDIPVTIPMHFLCNKVAVMKETGYLWRIRDGGNKSITQMTSSMNNLIDRIRILEMLDEFFINNVSDRELDIEKQRKNLETDLNIFVNQCISVPEDQASEMIDLINEYIDKAIDEEAFDRISVLNKQKYLHVRNRNLPELIKLLGYKDYNRAPLIEKEGRLFAELPEDMFPVADRDVTNELNNRWPRVQVEDVETGDSEIRIKAHLYMERFSIAFGEQEVKAFLTNDRCRKELKTAVFKDTELTAKSGESIIQETGTKAQYNYDGAGFIITIDADEINQGSYPDGDYHIELEYGNRLFHDTEILKEIGEKKRNRFNNSVITSGKTMCRLFFSQTDEVFLNISNGCIFVRDIQISDDSISVSLSEDVESIAAYTEHHGIKTAIAAEKIENRQFRVDCNEVETDRTYYLSDQESGKNILSGQIDIKGKNVVLVGKDNNNALYFTVKRSLTIVQDHSADKTKLNIKTKRITREKETLKPKSARIATEDKYLEEIIYLSKEGSCDADGSFSFKLNFNNNETVKNFYEGDRDIFIEYTFRDGKKTIEPVYCNDDLIYQARGKCLKTKVFVDNDAAVKLHIEQLWQKNQDTANKRKNLIYKEYPKFRKKHIAENRILFESMWGRNYSCNPQALYEYIDKNFPGFECIWSLNDARMPIKGKAKRVRRGTLEYYYYLATSKYLVNNVNFPENYIKREGQIVIETMHGTPLKTLGLDVAGDFPTQASIDKYIKKNANWDYLLVQGKFMEEKAYQIFRFSKTILKYGYPRTDKLFNADKDKILQLKKKLGLPADKKIILYTPTWRRKNRFDMKMDLEAMRKSLSDKYILLVRLHHLCAAGYSVPEDQTFIYDLTKYNCVEDLYLISDILITDYSSVMFDYALLEKPMIFFTYDMEEYSEKLRGLYVDFAGEAPGPICMTTEEIVDSILHIDEKNETTDLRVKAFMDKYLSYEQEDSAKAIVREVMAPKPFSQQKYRMVKFFKDDIYMKIKDGAKDKLRPFIYK